MIRFIGSFKRLKKRPNGIIKISWKTLVAGELNYEFSLRKGQ
jgi:hypothetical protein